MFHRTEIIGRCGRDPELRYTQTGQAVANFSVAVTEKFKDKEHTTWYPIQAWGKLAEVCGEYVSKGMLIFIDGRMNMREREKEGVKHRDWELIAKHPQAEIRRLLPGAGLVGDRLDTTFAELGL